MSLDLTVPEQNRLVALEGVIERGLATYLEVGAAAAEIRGTRLYRGTHATWDAYCRDRWGWSKQRANQLIAAAEVVANLTAEEPESTTAVVVVPRNEAQVRELSKVEPERRSEVWSAVVEADAPPTVKRIRATARKMGAVPHADKPVSRTADDDEPAESRARGMIHGAIDFAIVSAGMSDGAVRLSVEVAISDAKAEMMSAA